MKLAPDLMILHRFLRLGADLARRAPSEARRFSLLSGLYSTLYDLAFYNRNGFEKRLNQKKAAGERKQNAT